MALDLGYGWLLVGCGTAASIGGNVAHAQPDLVAQAIAAAIPLAVLAMLEGLKGDAGEVTRLAAQAAESDGAGALTQARQRRKPPRSDAPTPPPTWTPRRQLAPSAVSCPPGPDRPSWSRSGLGCRRPMPNRGRPANPGRPAAWPRPPAAAAAAPPASCNASAPRPWRTPGEPLQPAVARRRPRLCLPRHPGAPPLHYPLPHPTTSSR
jgi:hypothetical protein